MLKWHHAIHQVTGAMTGYFGTAPSPELLEQWAAELTAVAREMCLVAKQQTPKGRKKK